MHSCFRNLLMSCLNRACLLSDSKWIRGCSLWKIPDTSQTRLTQTLRIQAEHRVNVSSAILMQFSCLLHFVTDSLNPVLQIFFHISTITGICCMILCKILASVTHLVGTYCKNTDCSTWSICHFDCKSSFLAAEPLEKALGPMQGLGFDFHKLGHLHQSHCAQYGVYMCPYQQEAYHIFQTIFHTRI